MEKILDCAKLEPRFSMRLDSVLAPHIDHQQIIDCQTSYIDEDFAHRPESLYGKDQLQLPIQGPLENRLRLRSTALIFLINWLIYMTVLEDNRPSH